jgi:hypothetical protein
MPPELLQVDEKKLTINGVKFPEKEHMLRVASGIASNIYEGFIPTPKKIEIMRDYSLGKITSKQVVKLTRALYEPEQST